VLPGIINDRAADAFNSGRWKISKAESEKTRQRNARRRARASSYSLSDFPDGIHLFNEGDHHVMSVLGRVKAPAPLK